MTHAEIKATVASKCNTTTSKVEIKYNYFYEAETARVIEHGESFLVAVIRDNEIIWK